MSAGGEVRSAYPIKGVYTHPLGSMQFVYPRWWERLVLMFVKGHWVEDVTPNGADFKVRLQFKFWRKKMWCTAEEVLP